MGFGGLRGRRDPVLSRKDSRLAGFRVYATSGFRFFEGLGCKVWASGFRVLGLRGLGFTVGLLGGSWVVISRVISRVTIIVTHIRGLMTHLYYP